jgi:hypothetical protein
MQPTTCAYEKDSAGASSISDVQDEHLNPSECSLGCMVKFKSLQYMSGVQSLTNPQLSLNAISVNA